MFKTAQSDPVAGETIPAALRTRVSTKVPTRLIEFRTTSRSVVADVVDFDYGQTQPILAGAVSGHDDEQRGSPEYRRRPGLAISARPANVLCQQEIAVRNRGRGAGCSSPPW